MSSSFPVQYNCDIQSRAVARKSHGYTPPSSCPIKQQRAVNGEYSHTDGNTSLMTDDILSMYTAGFCCCFQSKTIVAERLRVLRVLPLTLFVFLWLLFSPRFFSLPFFLRLSFFDFFRFLLSFAVQSLFSSFFFLFFPSSVSVLFS